MQINNKIPFHEFEIRQCNLDDLNLILNLQNETLSNLTEKDLLRENSVDMLEECLCNPHFTIGAWYKGELAGFSVLYFPTKDEENLSLSLKDVDISQAKVANNKLCIVRSKYFGNSLQYHLGTLIEEYAKGKNINLLCATVSPKNKYSLNNMERLGYTCNRTLEKYGFERKLFYKVIK
ncbi:MAG: hypothetical protein RR568_04080 [Anaerorhabdus sp.]|uniref:hypothetical protein n=1 Tax=Anaerorhabdus sp. TaxID=1872524 RepID=UPI002FC9D95A